MVKQVIYEDNGDIKQRAADLLATLPIDAQTTRLSADSLPADVRFMYIGPVRVIQVWDPILDKVITRYDVQYEPNERVGE